MRINWKIVTASAIFFVLSLSLFLYGIEHPQKPNFDEFHYIPSAKQFLNLQENQNWEHPPLGKMLMAAGIGLFGDEPLGWRIASTVFGSLTLVGIFLWAWILFGSLETAVFAGVITLFNQLLFVQARIGMLDTFMFAFLVFALLFFSAAWKRQVATRTAERYLLGAGILFGLAVASKWSAIVPWMICLFLIVLLRVFQNWGIRFANASPWEEKFPDFEDFYSPRLLAGTSGWKLALYLVLIPLVVYFATFLPFLAVDREPRYGVWDLVLMQGKMFSGQLRVVNSHPYMSQWWQWPLMLRPIWYAYEHSDAHPSMVRGVILLGNPLVLWTGLLAWLVTVWAWLNMRSRQAFLIAVFYAVLFFPWVIIPRKILFFYYYYPAGTVLSLAIAFVFHHWEKRRTVFGLHPWRWTYAAIAFGIFIYFYPILSAQEISPQEFRNWMWFKSWI